MPTNTDRIERQIVLRAPRAVVWKAIADAKEFGAWFGVKIDGAFKAGARAKGKLTVAGYEHLTMELAIERVEPPALFTWRWHPYAIDPKVDYSKEAATLVEFRLEEAPENGPDNGMNGTRLTIVESGFDQLPVARRAEAFRMNDGGWAQQVKNIERHLGPR